MKLIVCIDDKNGMMFNKRRQSSDAEVCRHICDMATGNTIWMNNYTAKLFADWGNSVSVDEKFLARALPGDYCFVENVDFVPYLEKIHGIIVFKWNRTYPADMWFPSEILNGCKLVEQAEFPGKSHQVIKKEVYVL